jgi:FdhD protein
MNEFNLSDEVPVSIYVNGDAAATLMCTPEDLKDLAIGYLLDTGSIGGMADIAKISVCNAEREVYVNLRESLRKRPGFRDIITTACSQGFDYEEAIEGLENINSDHAVTILEIRQAVKRMVKESEKYIRHGGIHASALVSEGYFVTREDVGRHNSHDKVVGKAMQENVDLKASMIVTTGRISADMVFKAMNAGVPVLCSMSNPTKLAVDIAKKCGITLVGRCMGKDLTVYTQDERIIDKEKKICLAD